MNKNAAMRIRLEEKLHKEFLAVCRLEGIPAAQVIRQFMHSYVEDRMEYRHPDMFKEADMAEKA